MLFQTKYLLIVLPVTVFALQVLTGCGPRQYSHPTGYDLEHPQQMELGKVLNEISGITYDRQNNSLLAISDSKDKVIEIDLQKQKLKDVTGKIAEPGQDFEDLVLLDSTIYILASKGEIRAVPLYGQDSNSVQVYTLDVKGKNDFETLYYDTASKGLIMLCKECDMEKGAHTKTAYRFDLENKKFEDNPYYTISTKAVEDAVKDKKADFKPSAAAFHPLKKQLYILSSAGQLLVITDSKGKVLEVHRLNPDLFPQAEGIAFAPNGDMYISNEGKYGKPTLLLFPYKKTESKENE